jgi:aryl-alcohol dehydrogenase-like predicted oxidoreductase
MKKNPQKIKLGLGCAFIHRQGFAKGVQLIQYAIKSGITYFDVAPSYPDNHKNYGLNEKILGKAIKGQSKKLFIGTKVLARSYFAAKKEIIGSLKRLEKIDLLQLHSVDTKEKADKVFNKNGVYRALTEFRDKGYIKYIGITNHYDPDVLNYALKKFNLDAVMLPLGVINHFSKNFEKIARQCLKNKKMVIGILILGEGLLNQHADLAIRFAFNQPLTHILLGCSNLKELKNDIALFKKHINLNNTERKLLFTEAKKILVNQTPWWMKGPINENKL